MANSGSFEDDWRQQGECWIGNYPPAVFYPIDGAGVEVAKKICRICDIQADCLEYALANRETAGVWGGTSERERRRILKERRARDATG